MEAAFYKTVWTHMANLEQCEDEPGVVLNETWAILLVT